MLIAAERPMETDLLLYFDLLLGGYGMVAPGRALRGSDKHVNVCGRRNRVWSRWVARARNLLSQPRSCALMLGSFAHDLQSRSQLYVYTPAERKPSSIARFASLHRSSVDYYYECFPPNDRASGAMAHSLPYHRSKTKQWQNLNRILCCC
jgi:hypothetical protein